MQSLASKACLHPTSVLVHNQISRCCTVPFPHSYTLPSNPSFWLGCLRLLCHGSKQQLLQKPPPAPSQGIWPTPAYLNDAHCILKGCSLLFIFWFSQGYFYCLAYFSVSEELATSPSLLSCWFKEDTLAGALGQPVVYTICPCL